MGFQKRRLPIVRSTDINGGLREWETSFFVIFFHLHDEPQEEADIQWEDEEGHDGGHPTETYGEEGVAELKETTEGGPDPQAAGAADHQPTPAPADAETDHVQPSDHEDHLPSEDVPEVVGSPIPKVDDAAARTLLVEPADPQPSAHNPEAPTEASTV